MGFEGGQTPLHKRLPKRGFTKPNRKPLETLGLNKIEDYVTMGRLNPVGTGEGGYITLKDLLDANVLSSIKHGVKLVACDKIGSRWKAGPKYRLGAGSRPFLTHACLFRPFLCVPPPSLSLTHTRTRAHHLKKKKTTPKQSKSYTCNYPLNLEVTRASKQAIEAVEGAGGSVVSVHLNRLALRALTKPEKFEEGMVPRRARPPPKMLEYYIQHKNRGYLSKEIQLKRQLNKLGLKE